VEGKARVRPAVKREAVNDHADFWTGSSAAIPGR
jgi:hypothetical protein